jgi:hypothetical protein
MFICYVLVQFVTHPLRTVIIFYSPFFYSKALNIVYLATKGSVLNSSLTKVSIVVLLNIEEAYISNFK